MLWIFRLLSNLGNSFMRKLALAALSSAIPLLMPTTDAAADGWKRKSHVHTPRRYCAYTVYYPVPRLYGWVGRWGWGYGRGCCERW
jgi:hypothetical protein